MWAALFQRDLGMGIRKLNWKTARKMHGIKFRKWSNLWETFIPICIYEFVTLWSVLCLLYCHIQLFLWTGMYWFLRPYLLILKYSYSGSGRMDWNAFDWMDVEIIQWIINPLAVKDRLFRLIFIHFPTTNIFNQISNLESNLKITM